MKVSKREVRFAILVPMIATAATVYGSHEAPQLPGPSKSNEPPQTVASLARLPLSFEANEGQTNPKAMFISRGRTYTLFLTGDEAVLSLRPSSTDTRRSKLDVPDQNAHPSSSQLVSMRLAGANRAATVKGLDELPGKSNYFVGNDPRTWRANVPTYAKVKYQDVYQGIDLIYYGNQQQLEYDFVVAPGSDPAAIQLSLETRSSKDGTRSGEAAAVVVDEKGDLVIRTPSGDVRFLKPVVYQTDATRRGATSIGDREAVDGRFVLLAANRVGFAVGDYDRTRPLIIDPVLSYSSYLGGAAIEAASGVAVDASGNFYVSGETCTTDPINESSGCDATVTKINSSGTEVVYSTVLGGSNHADAANAVALDTAENAYATGLTCSPDFPVTAGAFQTTLGDVCDAFVTKLGSSGELLYSTYVGGSKSTDGNTADDVGIGIAVDSTGNAYVAGQTCSSNFPTKNAFQSTFLGGQIPCDGFAAKLNPAGEGTSDLIYSTYLGGAAENDAALGIALDPSKLVYVMGQAGSSDFPTTTGAFQKTKNGSFDVFVSKLDMTKSGSGSLLYSTFLGGDAQEPNSGGGIAVDAFGMIYLTGTTVSDDFPTTSGAFQTSPSISPDPNKVRFNVFVTKLNPAGGGASDLLYSTYLGGTDSEFAGGVAVGSTGNIYVAGSTCSAEFPHTTSAFQSSLSGRCDGFVAKLNPAGGGSSDLVYSTFFGGDDNDFASAIALDSTGNAAVSGSTSSADLPHTADAAQTGLGGGVDGFVARIPIGNFSISAIASIAADVAGRGTSTVTVNSIDEFNAPVSLSVSGQPTGVTASLNPTSVTPSAGSSAASTLTVNFGLTATPGTFSLAIAGTSGLLTHSVSAQVTVQASTSGTTTVIDGLGNAGCIDNSGISGSLIARLTQAQDDIDAGRIQDAINTLSALLNQLLAQSGKHIFSSCTIDGQTFNPAQVLINDVRAILATLQA